MAGAENLLITESVLVEAEDIPVSGGAGRGGYGSTRAASRPICAPLCYVLPPPASYPLACRPAPIARRPAPAGFTRSSTTGSGMMARRDPAGVRLLTRNGHDWTARFPLIVQAAGALQVRSFLVDGEAVACDGDGMPSFDRLRYRRQDGARVPVRLRPARARRQGPAPRTARGPQGDARLRAA